MAESKDKKANDSEAASVIVNRRSIITTPESETSKASIPAKEDLKTPAEPKIVTPLPSQVADTVKQSETPAEKTAEPELQSNDTENSSEAVVDTIADKARDKKKEDELAKADADHQAHMDQLITEKKYFVPLGVTHRQKTHRPTLFAIIVLAAVAVTAIAAYQLGIIEL